jgi:hypothetical protein
MSYLNFRAKAPSLRSLAPVECHISISELKLPRCARSLQIDVISRFWLLSSLAALARLARRIQDHRLDFREIAKIEVHFAHSDQAKPHEVCFLGWVLGFSQKDF